MRHFQICLIGCGLLLLLAASCTQKPGKEKTDWSVSLDHERREPYGSALAYATLPQYFPEARREPLTKWFRYTGVDEQMHGGVDSAALLVMLGLDYYVTAEEWLKVLKFAYYGNEVFLLASRLDNQVLRSLGLEKIKGGLEDYPLRAANDGSGARNALRLLPDTTVSYGYTGRSIASYFRFGTRAPVDSIQVEEDGSPESLAFESRTIYASIDTPAQILGLAKDGPDFIRYRVGSGHITLHAAPLVLSNYFLLQPGNRPYLDGVWQAFPANISVVYWNEFFKRTTQESKLSVLLKYPAMRWALLIASLTLLLYVLFGMKRMQRVVPVLPPVENDSVSFVETVGRLYFNKGNHANLAEKMAQHFLDWVRTHYYLDTSQINEAFNRQLAAKSGKPETEVAALMNRIHDLRLGSADVTPEYLHELYRSIQSFYRKS